MVQDWYTHFGTLIDGIETALQEHENTFGPPVVGPVDWGRLDYPAAHVLPDTSNYQGGNEYRHRVFVNFYFEIEKLADYQDHLRTASDTTNSIMTVLEADSDVVEFKPISVDHFAGASDANLLALIRVEWRAKTLADFAE